MCCMCFCLILNGFRALQLPYIVQTRPSQCQTCQCVLWGLQSIWLCAQKVQPPHDTHTSPCPLGPPPCSFSSLQQRVPRWHHSALLAWWPFHHLVRSPWLAPTPYRECFCVKVCSEYECPGVFIWRLSGPGGTVPLPRHQLIFSMSSLLV